MIPDSDNAPRSLRDDADPTAPIQAAGPLGGPTPALAKPAISDLRIAVSLACAGFAFSIACIGLSPEGQVHYDDLSHYLFAHWAWTHPGHLLDEWGRPGFTSLYFLPAGLGWWGGRVFSAMLSAVSALLAYRIAKRLGMRHAPAVVLFTYAQPLFFQLSQTTLTETALAFYLVLAVFLAQRGRWSLSAAVLSLGFVTRHEAILFLPIWLWWAWRCRVAIWRLWPLAWAMLAANWLAWAADLRPPVLRLFDAKPSSQYGQGGWLSFFSRSLEAWGPAIASMTVVGLLCPWAEGWRRGRAARRKAAGEQAGRQAAVEPGDVPADHQRAGVPSAASTFTLLTVCVVAYFAAQTIIRALGLFDSGGYARFLVPLSPLVAIFVLRGWHALWAADPRRRTALIVLAASMVWLWLSMERQLVLHARSQDLGAELPGLVGAAWIMRVATGVIVLLALLVRAIMRNHPRRARPVVPVTLVLLMLIATLALCHPLRVPGDVARLMDLERWLAKHGYVDREIITANRWVDYRWGQVLLPSRPDLRQRLADAPVGTLFAWEPRFAASADHDVSLDETANSPLYREIRRLPPLPGRSEPFMIVFEKTAVRAEAGPPIGTENDITTSRPGS